MATALQISWRCSPASFVRASVSLSALSELLNSLPTAHGLRAKDIVRLQMKLRLRRGRQPGAFVSTGDCSSPLQMELPRIRFVFITDADESEVSDYHDALIAAEVLLDRMLLARLRGLRPIHTELDGDAERRLFERPARGAFEGPHPEYRRWYTSAGSARQIPLNIDELTAELMVEDAFDVAVAQRNARQVSLALSADDQRWLLERAHQPSEHRPLHASEFGEMVRAIEGALSPPPGHIVAARANYEIAHRAAAAIGGMLDHHTRSPFRKASLSAAYDRFHAEHLERIAVALRTAPTQLSQHPSATGWFTARSARLDAEMQTLYAQCLHSVYESETTFGPRLPPALRSKVDEKTPT